MKFIEVEQIKSATRREASQQRTLIGLGLNKIGRVRWVEDTPSSWGMIRKVSHLLRVQDFSTGCKLAVADTAKEETADTELLKSLVFDPRKIVSEAFGRIDLRRGKTPDFKLLLDGKLSGYCEMKSPRDDYAFATPAEGGECVRENLPHYRKLGSHVIRAAQQLQAVNPDHEVPNLVAFVSHSPNIGRVDLRATIIGLSKPEANLRLFMLGAKMQQQVWAAARIIDLFLWIDANKRTVQHLSQAGALHAQAALSLFGFKTDVSLSD